MQEILLVTTVSAATDFSSPPLLLNDSNEAYVQVLFSGSNVVGTLILEASADGTTYVTVAGSSQTVSASGSFVWNVVDMVAKYLRVGWDYTSGTGNITIKANIKNEAVTPTIAR